MVGALSWPALVLSLAAQADTLGDGTGIVWMASFEAARAAGIRQRRLLLVKPLGKREAEAGNW
jgi:hypothetical protein